MGYLKIKNLYQDQSVLNFKEVYAMEKVHGTSAHIRWSKRSGIEFFAGGIPYDEFCSMIDERFSIAGLEAALNDWGSEQLWDTVKIFGEAYGGKCQKMGRVYGPLNFIAFEVRIDKAWLAVHQAEQICKDLGLPFVPYERGPAELDWLNEQRNRPSRVAALNGMGDNHDSEGIVIRPLEEYTKNNGNRIIAKYKREKFRETKTPREVSPEKLKRLEDARAVAEEWVTGQRLLHVIDSLKAQNKFVGDMNDVPNVIGEMTKDIRIESGVGTDQEEIAWSKEVQKAIGSKTAELFKKQVSRITKETELAKGFRATGE